LFKNGMPISFGSKDRFMTAPNSNNNPNNGQKKPFQKHPVHPKIKVVQVKLAKSKVNNQQLQKAKAVLKKAAEQKSHAFIGPKRANGRF